MSSIRRTRATSKRTAAETASALIKKRKLEGKPNGEASEPLEVSDGETKLSWLKLNQSLLRRESQTLRLSKLELLGQIPQALKKLVKRNEF